ncbi:hypothetical protein TNCV_5072571 [Trichonephila clavipes]|nr:hypothetical protein TNCV_5072571 [Trichonephila clavipes]
MPSEQQKMFPKKGNYLQRPLENLKMWNEFVCQFKPLCDNMIQQIFLPALQERDLHKVWLQQQGVTAHTPRISMGILRAAFPRITDLPARGCKLARVLT